MYLPVAGSAYEGREFGRTGLCLFIFYSRLTLLTLISLLFPNPYIQRLLSLSEQSVLHGQYSWLQGQTSLFRYSLWFGLPVLLSPQ
jgi:hypothetical protein